MTLLFCIASNQSWRPAPPFTSESLCRRIKVGEKDFDLYWQSVSEDASNALLVAHANDVGIVTPLKMIEESAVSNLPAGDLTVLETILVTTQRGRRGRYEDRSVVVAVSEGTADRKTYPVFYWESIEALARRLAQGGKVDERAIFEVLSAENADRGMDQIFAAQCGFLCHSWLKNDVLKRDAGYVAQMRCRQSLREKRDSFERKIRPGGEYELNFSQARQIVRSAIASFGPTWTPNRSLSGKSQEARLNDAPRPDIFSVARIELIIDDWERVFQEFRDVWYQQPQIEETVIQEKFKLVQEHAGKLRELLEWLPKGIASP
jgi:hypothetical protein